MAAKKNLNSKDSEYIEKNHLEQNPEGLPPCDETLTDNKVVISNHIPEMRKAIFVNSRDPGVALHFHYHSKTHPLKHYTLYDGLEHVLPEEVINHLENCGQAMYAYRKSPAGHPEHYVSGYKYMFQFRNKRVA